MFSIEIPRFEEGYNFLAIDIYQITLLCLCICSFSIYSWRIGASYSNRGLEDKPEFLFIGEVNQYLSKVEFWESLNQIPI